MVYLVSIATSVASAILVFILKSVITENKKLKDEKEKARKEEDKALRDGMVCLLRVEMIKDHKKYTERESISTHGLQNWLAMYKAYHKLGGNGMIDHMKVDIEDLPIRG